MKLKPSILVGLSLAALAAATGFCAWLLITEPWIPKQRLRDGTVVALEAVSWGKQHHFVRWTAVEKLLQALGRPQPNPRSRAFARSMATRTLAGSSREDSLALVFSQRPLGPRGGPTPPPILRDSHGCGFRFHSGSGRDHRETGTRRWIWLFEAVPRREATLTAELHGDSDEVPEARFVLSNSAPGPYPTWTAPPSPVTARTGELEVTLLRLLHSSRWRGVFSGADLRVSRAGKPVEDWIPAAVTVSDATGNRVRATAARRRIEDADIEFPSLCRRESAWKLVVELAPAHPDSARPDVTWTVANVPVPGRGTVAEAPQRFESGGVRLRFLGLATGGRVTWRGGQITRERQPVAQVRMATRARSLDLRLMEVTDERGRSLPQPQPPGARRAFTRPDVQYRPYEQDYRFALTLRPGVRRVNLRFGLYLPRIVELLARP